MTVSDELFERRLSVALFLSSLRLLWSSHSARFVSWALLPAFLPLLPSNIALFNRLDSPSSLKTRMVSTSTSKIIGELWSADRDIG